MTVSQGWGRKVHLNILQYHPRLEHFSQPIKKVKLVNSPPRDTVYSLKFDDDGLGVTHKNPNFSISSVLLKKQTKKKQYFCWKSENIYSPHYLVGACLRTTNWLARRDPVCSRRSRLLPSWPSAPPRCGILVSRISLFHNSPKILWGGF